MKATFTITSLNDIGDHVKVTAQGAMDRDADWQSMRGIQFDAPIYTGKRYAIGQKLRVTIQPGPK